MLIPNFKDLKEAILLNYVAWWQTGNAIMVDCILDSFCKLLITSQVASVGIYVQIFFCYRLWFISEKQIWFILPVGLVLLFAYASVCLAVRQPHLSFLRAFLINVTYSFRHTISRKA